MAQTNSNANSNASANTANIMEKAKAPTATQKASEAAQKPSRSLFLKNWDEVKRNARGFNGAYKTLYNNAGEALRAALIAPDALFNDAAHADKKASYYDYANKKKAKDGGISPWYAYIWANKEMKEYRAKATTCDARAAAIAKVQRAEKVARQNAANAKK